MTLLLHLCTRSTATGCQGSQLDMTFPYFLPPVECIGLSITLKYIASRGEDSNWIPVEFIHIYDISVQYLEQVLEG